MQFMMLGPMAFLMNFDFFKSSLSRRAQEHEVSFALTIPHVPRNHPKRPDPRSPTHIPYEIVQNILELAYLTHDLEPDYALLANCSLVSKDWSLLSQKLLFSQVTLHTEAAFNSFRSAVDCATPRSDMLRKAVLAMRVVLDHNQPHCLSQRSFARAVILCPNLAEINMSLYGHGAPGQDIVGAPDLERMKRSAPSFDETTLALLRTGPHVKSLHFNNWSDNATSLTQLLDVWPSLISLVISGSVPSLPSSASESSSCILEHLRMNFQVSPSSEFLKWLLQNSRGSLRSLEFEREPSAEMISNLLEEHGSTLVSLAIPSCSSRESIGSISKCTDLREFRLEDARDFLLIHKALPSTLEHLAIGVHKETPLQPVIQLIKKSDVLKGVTMNMWEGAGNHSQMAAVKIACAMQGVELKKMKNIKLFRTVSRAHDS